MFHTRKVLMAAVLGLAGLVAIPASAQSGGWYNRGNWGWQDGDHDRDDHDRGNSNYNRDSQNKAYQQGYKDGVWDTQHGPQQRSRNWSNSYDAQAYRDGYNAGYRGNGGYSNNRGSWGRGGYGYDNGGYGNRGGYGNSQQGYNDGLNDGSRDRQTGHSFRPTQQSDYKHADRGYGGGISKDEYKQMYRNAYMQGYQRGYYGRR